MIGQFFGPCEVRRATAPALPRKSSLRFLFKETTFVFAFLCVVRLLVCFAAGASHQQWLWATGLEHQPGPQQPLPPHWIRSEGPIIEVANITSMDTHVETLVHRHADFTFFQEHSAPPAAWPRLCALHQEQKRKVHFGPLDPNASHLLGGVGCSTKATNIMHPVKPITEAFRQAVETGRVMHYAIALGKGSKLAGFYVIYGWSGGHQALVKASKTNLLLDAILQEIEAQPPGPTAIVGDLNAEPQDIGILHNLLLNKGWTDVGAQAHCWGEEDNTFTCLTAGALRGTRRDYIFVNPQLLPAIRHFRVVPDDDHPVHSTLQVQIAVGDLNYEVTQQRQPHDIKQLLDESFIQLFGTQPSAEGPSEGDVAGISMPKPALKTANAEWRAHRAEFDRALHARMDAKMSGASRHLSGSLTAQNTDAFWATWSKAVEEAVVEHCGILEHSAAKEYMGRGANLTRRRTVQPAFKGDSEEGTLLQPDLPCEVQRLLRQATRCHQLADKLNCIHRGQLGDKQAAHMRMLCSHTTKAILADICPPPPGGDQEEVWNPSQLSSCLQDEHASHCATVIALKAAGK